MHLEFSPVRRHIRKMQTGCPKCKTMVRSNGSNWEILRGPCLDLAGTTWENRAEFCPTLSHVAEPDVVLPDVNSRLEVIAEIERNKLAKLRK